MGCFGSKESKKSNDIEAQLKKDRKNFESEVKLLLLGAGESGKSTFVKQMKIIHKNGFTAQDLRVYSGHVRRNVLQGMRQLCEGRGRLDVEWGSTASNALAEEFFGPDSEDDDMSAEKLDACGTLWKDPALRQVWDRRSECQINDSAHYFLERLEVIRDEGYRPTTDDILHTRVRTTGIVETRFEYGGLAFLIVDVGGQRNERKKWIHCFESVTAVLFVVALSEFDQMLFEDETVRRMDESRRLFEEICNSQWFRDTPMILFLNKFDLFTEKINKGVSITGCFPDYDGAAEPQAGADYIAKQFVSLNQNANKPVYSHIISSTDTNNVKKVFDDVKAIILQTNLAKGGFYPM